MVFDKVKEIIVDSMGKRLKMKEEDITLETGFITDLHADSVDLANIITSIEDEFGLMIDDDEMDGMATIGDAVSYIEDHVK